MGIHGIQGLSYGQWPVTKQITEYRPDEAILREEPKQTLPALPQVEQETGDMASPVDHRSRIADLEDISLTFHKGDSLDYMGKESGLENLDVQKAISDMKKDEVLQEYQYFVGSAQNLMMQNSEDGAVFRKLGF